MIRFWSVMTAFIAGGCVLLVGVALVAGGMIPRGGQITFSVSSSGFSPAASGSTMRGGVYLLDVSRGLTARITVQSADALAWSPDGTRLAFVANGTPAFGGGLSRDIFVLDLREMTAHPFAATPSQELAPTWSPDGTRIAFATNRDLNYGVYVAEAGAGNTAAVLAGGGAQGYLAFTPEWSPDGTLIAFYANLGSAPGQYDVYIVEAASGQIARMTSVSGSYEWLTWSPDGTAFVYTAPRGGTDEVFVMDVTTGTARNLSDHIARDDMPNWSPDSTRVVFRSRRGGDEDIFVADVASGNVTRLGGASPVDFNPVWSPDGSQIAFLSQRSTREAGLYMMDADGGNIRPLWGRPGASVFVLMWRPGESGAGR